ncbi:hypothetical protein JCM8097_008101 [Rhodosporidiobolus ruineniae]
MARRGSFDASEEEAIALQQADELLQQDDDRRASLASTSTRASTSGRRPSSGLLPPRQGSARSLVVSYAATVLFGTLAARQLARLARDSHLSTLAFPLVHFAALGLIVFVVGCARGSRPVSPGGGGFGRDAAGGGGGVGRKAAWRAGAASALSLALRIWEVRMGSARLCEALELFAIPTLLALLPYAATRLPYASAAQAHPSTTFASAAAVATFLVGFALVGTPASGVGLTAALLRMPLEAAAMVLLKEGLTGDAGAISFLRSASLSATLTSLVTFGLGALFAYRDERHKLAISIVLSLAPALVFSLLSQVAFIFSLSFFPSPATTASTLFPRNLFLLVWSTFGREGAALRNNWTQACLVYIVGSAALAWADTDLSAAAKSLRNGGEGSTFLPMNGNGLPPSSVSPTSSTFGTPSPPPNVRKSSDHHLPLSIATRPSLLTLLPFLPLLVCLVTHPTATASVSAACAYLPPAVRSTVCPASGPTSRTVDLVVSYFDEDLQRTRKELEDIRATAFVKQRSSRVVIYNKGPRGEKEIRRELALRRADEVVPLPNLGREGATYLKHILLHYNSTMAALSHAEYPPAVNPTLVSALAHLRTTTLADHTYFLQPHLAWEWVAKPRLQIIEPDSGFAHLAPLIRGDCGRDTRVDINFPIVKEIYNIFMGEICPPTGQLMAWSGQFVVSKRRILANPYKRYKALDDLMEAPEGHWVHDIWGPNESGGPSNPAIGHSVERAWPVIFGCSDPRLADECTDEESKGPTIVAVKEKCQCLDV